MRILITIILIFSGHFLFSQCPANADQTTQCGAYCEGSTITGFDGSATANYGGVTYTGTGSMTVNANGIGTLTIGATDGCGCIIATCDDPALGCQKISCFEYTVADELDLTCRFLTAGGFNADGNQGNCTHRICDDQGAVANVLINGGTAPFTYAWSTGGTASTETICNPCTDGFTASVTVTDGNGCTGVADYTVEVKTIDQLNLCPTN